jgi:hypothetical protein
MLHADLVEQALIEQAGGEGIGLAAGELERVRQSMARRPARPEGGLEQSKLIRAQDVPGQ